MTRLRYVCGTKLAEIASRTFRNWNGSAFSTPSVVAEPKDLDELIEVVRDHERYPSPVRATGSFHSLNQCFARPGAVPPIREREDPGGRFLSPCFSDLM